MERPVKIQKGYRIARMLVSDMVEIALALLLFVIMEGKIALPQFYLIDTSSFDPYTLILWGLIPLVTVVAFIIAVINHAKTGSYRVF